MQRLFSTIRKQVISRWKLVLPLCFLLILLLGSGVYALSQSDSTQNTVTEEDAGYDEDVVVYPLEEGDGDDEQSDETEDEEQDDEAQVVTPPTTPQPETNSSGLVSLLVLVNKHSAISPLGYSPSNLTAPNVTKRSGAVIDARASGALESMFTDASNAGLSLMLSNAFRSYSTQQGLYNNYVARDGQTAADTYSARPGHSEHQTGLAADIIVPSGTCSLEACFGDLPEGKWLAENSYKYGFIIRYTKTNKSEAGYTYEPWHIRYIGVSDATSYYQSGASSLESYLGKPAAPDYL